MIIKVLDTIPPMCWIGCSVFFLAIAYCVWLWNERMP